MNFQSLKGMIDTLTQTFKCPECSAEVNDSTIDIVGAAGTTINIDIECYNCWRHSMVRSEVYSIDLKNNPLAKNIPSKKLMKKNLIKDEQIVDLNKNLNQKDISISDLFWNEK